MGCGESCWNPFLPEIQGVQTSGCITRIAHRR
jgi:hypothetical protein